MFSDEGGVGMRSSSVTLRRSRSSVGGRREGAREVAVFRADARLAAVGRFGAVERLAAVERLPAADRLPTAERFAADWEAARARTIFVAAFFDFTPRARLALDFEDLRELLAFLADLTARPDLAALFFGARPALVRRFALPFAMTESFPREWPKVPSSNRLP